ncbi:MAG: excinuclease ABC subunit UvrB [bacterium]|nr:excinuclease ABC subunit UvrB [bacterium]
MKFQLVSDFKPTGDQPTAISALIKGVNNKEHAQTLVGVTGSGKTFTMANVIAETQRPTLVISHNKTLAAQLASEFKEFFPHNAVHYFVSYYDYFQPESYIPRTDTYIEKTTALNEEIDRMRHAATVSLLSRKDVIIVASVSCIYGLSPPEFYKQFSITMKTGNEISRAVFLKRLVDMQYFRTDTEFVRGKFRVKGEIVEIFPATSEYTAYRISFFGDEVEKIESFHALTHDIIDTTNELVLFPATHYVAPEENRGKILHQISNDMKKEVAVLEKNGKELEAHRLKQRITYDIDMIQETGFVNGIENYSRYFDNRKPGVPPSTLLAYFPDNFLTFIDESHVTVSQIGGMYLGDKSRKQTLVDYGFRLKAAMDNRPLQAEEFNEHINQVIYVSATPRNFELEASTIIAEQLIRPTGLLDPPIDLRPAANQINDLINEINIRIEKGERVLVTTLTKRMSEELTEFLQERNIKVQYLHSEVDTLERLEILRDLRMGVYDVLVGINLLREGLDLPEVSLVAILDADKQGFLRSATSLIQTMGRAARHENGSVIMYGDQVTDAMKQAINETLRRRKIQKAYNKKYNITPQSIKRKISDNRLSGTKDEASTILDKVDPSKLSKTEKEWLLSDLKQHMKIAAENLQFEQAAQLRDEIDQLEK